MATSSTQVTLPEITVTSAFDPPITVVQLNGGSEGIPANNIFEAQSSPYTITYYWQDIGSPANFARCVFTVTVLAEGKNSSRICEIITLRADFVCVVFIEDS